MPPTTPCCGSPAPPKTLGYDGFFRSDHYRAGGRRRRTAGSHRLLDDAGRIRARDVGAYAWARWSRRRRSGCPGRWRSRSHRWTRCPAAGSSWAWAPAGTRPNTLRMGSRSRTAGSACSRSSFRSSRGSGARRPARRTRSRASTTSSPTPPRSPSRRSARIRRSSSAVAGPQRTPRLAATYASEFNSNFRPSDQVADSYARVRAACEAVGRDPDTLTLSVTMVVACGRTEAEIARRAEAISAKTAANQMVLRLTPDQLRRKTWRISRGRSAARLPAHFRSRRPGPAGLVANEVLPHAADPLMWRCFSTPFE